MAKNIIKKSFIFAVGLAVTIFAIFALVGLDPRSSISSNVFIAMLLSIGFSNLAVEGATFGLMIAWFILMVIGFAGVLFIQVYYADEEEGVWAIIKKYVYAIYGGIMLLFFIIGLICSGDAGLFALSVVRTILFMAIGLIAMMAISALLKVIEIFMDFLVKTVKYLIALFVKDENKKEKLKSSTIYNQKDLIIKHSIRFAIIFVLFMMSLYVLALNDTFLDFSGVPAIFRLPISNAIVGLFGIGGIGIYADSWNIVIMVVTILIIYYIYSYVKPIVLYYKIVASKAETEQKTSKVEWIFSLIRDFGVLVLISLCVFGIFTALGLTDGLTVDSWLIGASAIVENGALALGIWALTFIILTASCFAFFWLVYFCIQLLPKIFHKTAIKVVQIANDAGEAIVTHSASQTVASTIVVAEGARIIRKGISIPTEISGDEEDDEEDETMKHSSKVDNSIFPTLTSIDIEFEAYEPRQMDESDKISLDQMVVKFQNYLASKHKIYFDISVIRAFVAGFGASRLMILEGVSGTGKSSLPRLFSEFIGANNEFVAVQSTWRDRIDLLGYYNDFSGTFKETDFLQSLYKANYQQEKLSIAVLDEANLSRMEYYFADFISVLEFPQDQWKLNLINEVHGYKMPALIPQGDITIPQNQFFVATANKDDSTYTITERVYDRAIVISFDDRHKKIEAKQEQDAIFWTSEYMQQQFASANDSNVLTDADINNFDKIIDFCDSMLDITVGNRIYAQIEKFANAYVACGGTKEEALDFILSGKVIRKVASRFDESIGVNLTKLSTLLAKTYKKGAFKRTAETIKRIVKRL